MLQVVRVRSYIFYFFHIFWSNLECIKSRLIKVWIKSNLVQTATWDKVVSHILFWQVNLPWHSIAGKNRVQKTKTNRVLETMFYHKTRTHKIYPCAGKVILSIASFLAFTEKADALWISRPVTHGRTHSDRKNTTIVCFRSCTDGICRESRKERNDDLHG